MTMISFVSDFMASKVGSTMPKRSALARTVSRGTKLTSRLPSSDSYPLEIPSGVYMNGQNL